MAARLAVNCVTADSRCAPEGRMGRPYRAPYVGSFAIRAYATILSRMAVAQPLGSVGDHGG